MRKDTFKNHCQNAMTTYDLDCKDLFKPRWRGKEKRLIRKIARKRVNREVDY